MLNSARAKWSVPRRNAYLAMLCVIGLIGFIDRQIITVLVEPIKKEFGASDAAMGALTGIIFSGFYAIASVPLARLSDHYSRRNVIAASLAFWSVMTSTGGLAISYITLAASRVGVAVGEAAVTPASHSMIADLFPVHRRGTAIAVFSSAQSIGIGLGVLLGGVLATAFDWRTSFLIVGMPGILVAMLLVTFFREPPRGMSDGLIHVGERMSFAATVGDLWRVRTYRCLFLTVWAGGFCGFGMLAWGPSFLARVHGMDPSSIGVWFGASVAAALVLGNMLWGWLGDHLGGRDMRNYLRIAGLGPISAFVPGLVFAFSPRWEVAIAALFVFMLALTAHTPTIYSLAQTLVQPRMRATAAVILGLGSGVLGAGLAPLVIGAVSDRLTEAHGAEAIRYAFLVPLAGALLAGVPALVGTRYVRAEYASRQRALANVRSEEASSAPTLD